MTPKETVRLLEKRREAILESYGAQIHRTLSAGDMAGAQRAIARWQRLTGAINTAIKRLVVS